MPSCPVVKPEVMRIFLVDVAKKTLADLRARSSKPTEANSNVADIAKAERAVTIAAANDDWLEVKRQLSIGEEQDAFAGVVKGMYAGEKAEIDPHKLALAKFSKYVTGWSFIDFSGAPLPLDAVSTIDPERFAELALALDQHEAAIEQEREARKNALSTAIA